MVLVVVVVVVVALASIGAYLAFLTFRQATQFTQATVDGVVWDLNYSTGGTYFGGSSQSSCASCPMSGLVGTTFTVSMTFVNSATAQSHALLGFHVPLPFRLISVYPSTPISVLPGGTVSVTVSALYPPTAGGYTMTVNVDVA